MIFALSGTSGSGKTTLGEIVAEGLSIPFVKTDITGIGKAAGFKPTARLKIADRIELQEALFQGMKKLCDEAESPAIFDRSPMDLVMYLMGEIHMNSHKNLTGEQMAWVRDYTARCQKLTAARVAHLFVTMPLPDYEEVSTRPKHNPAYQEHTNLILFGALATMTEPFTYTILRTPDLEIRTEAMAQRIVEAMDGFAKQRRSSRHIH